MNFFPRPLACALTWLAACSLGSSLAAQQIYWTGANGTAFNQWGWATGANWSTGTAPTAGSDIVIATASNSFPSPDTMAMNSNTTYGSLTFDNAAGQFPSVLRITPMGSNTFTVRTVTLSNTTGSIINAVNGANVQLFGNITGGTTASTFHLAMGFNGVSNINVDSSSSFGIYNGTRFTAVAGFTAGLVKTGGGTLQISTPASTYTGGFTLNEGTVLVGGNSTVASGVITQGAFGVGTLTLNGGSLSAVDSTTRVIDNPLNLSGTINLGSTTRNGTLSFTGAAGSGVLVGDTVLNLSSTVSISQNLTGAHSLTKTGSGTLTLAGAGNTYTGGTILQGGMLQMQSSDKLPTASAVTFDGGILRVTTGGFTAANHTTTVTANGGAFNLANGIFLTWSGNIGGVGALTMNTTSLGTLTLSGNNTYSGGTIVDAGTVRGSLGTGNLALAAGATYDLFSADRSIGALSGAGNVTLGARTLTVASEANTTFSGLISGTGGLTKSGSGKLDLTGTSTYTGATSVVAGLLSGNIGSGDLTVASGATYELGGANRSVAALAGGGAVELGGSSLTSNSTGSSTFDGSIGGTGGVSFTGTGKTNLTGTNTFTGPTQVSAGELAVNGSLASAVNVASGATLSGAGTFLNSVTIAGAHQPGNSPGVQTFQDLTYAAGATINWELATNTTALGVSTAANFDQIVVNGALDFAGATALSLRFDGPGSTVDWTNSLWAANQTWVIFVSSNTSNFSNLSLNTSNWLDSAGRDFNSTLAGSAFNLDFLNGAVQLNYTVAAVPEPSTWQALGLGLALMGLYWRRRRRAA